MIPHLQIHLWTPNFRQSLKTCKQLAYILQRSINTVNDHEVFSLNGSPEETNNFRMETARLLPGWPPPPLITRPLPALEPSTSRIGTSVLNWLPGGAVNTPIHNSIGLEGSGCMQETSAGQNGCLDLTVATSRTCRVVLYHFLSDV